MTSELIEQLRSARFSLDEVGSLTKQAADLIEQLQGEVVAATLELQESRIAADVGQTIRVDAARYGFIRELTDRERMQEILDAPGDVIDNRIDSLRLQQAFQSTTDRSDESTDNHISDAVRVRLRRGGKAKSR